MARGRKRSSNMEFEGTTDIVNYGEMYELIDSYIEKGTWKDEDQFYEFVDLASDVYNIEKLEEAEDTATLERIYGEDKDEILDDFKAGAEMSGLSDFELKELKKYANLTTRYDRWIEPIELMINKLLNDEGALTNTKFLDELNTAIQQFGDEEHQKADDQRKRAYEIAKEWDDVNPQLIQEIEEIQAGMNKTNDFMGKVTKGIGKAKDGLIAASAEDAAGKAGRVAADVAGGANKLVGGLIRKVTGRKNQTKSGEYDDLFEEVRLILRGMKDMKAAVIKMERDLVSVRDDKLAPIARQIEIHGNLATAIADNLRQRKEAMRELEYRLENDVLPKVEKGLKESKDGENFIIEQRHKKLTTTISEVTRRRGQLGKLEAQATSNAGYLDEAKDALTNTKNFVYHYVRELIPSARDTMTTLTIFMNNLEAQRVMVQSKDFLKVMGDALESAAGTQMAMEEAMGESGLSNDQIIKQLEGQKGRRAERNLKQLESRERHDRSEKRLTAEVENQEEETKALTKKLLAASDLSSPKTKKDAANDDGETVRSSRKTKFNDKSSTDDGQNSETVDKDADQEDIVRSTPSRKKSTGPKQ